jgi:hypothetical protein
MEVIWHPEQAAVSSCYYYRFRGESSVDRSKLNRPLPPPCFNFVYYVYFSIFLMSYAIRSRVLWWLRRKNYSAVPKILGTAIFPTLTSFGCISFPNNAFSISLVTSILRVSSYGISRDFSERSTTSRWFPAPGLLIAPLPPLGFSS